MKKKEPSNLKSREQPNEQGRQSDHLVNLFNEPMISFKDWMKFYGIQQMNTLDTEFQKLRINQPEKYKDEEVQDVMEHNPESSNQLNAYQMKLPRKNTTNLIKNFILRFVKWLQNDGYATLQFGFIPNIRQFQRAKAFRQMIERLKKLIKDGYKHTLRQLSSLLVYKQQSKRHLSRFLLKMCNDFLQIEWNDLPQQQQQKQYNNFAAIRLLLINKSNDINRNQLNQNKTRMRQQME